MKKSIVFVMALALLAGGGRNLFAQEVKVGSGTLSFGGKIMTGVEVTFDDNGNEDGVVRMHNETEGTQLRVELTTSYTNEKVGFTSRLRADDAEVGKAAVGVRYAYGWIDLFDGIFRPVGGFLDVNSNIWGTIGDLDVDVAGAGLRLEFRPIAGLSFGPFFRVTSQDVNANQTGGFWTEKPATDIEGFFKATAFGAAYQNKAFYLRLQYAVDTNVFNDDPNGQFDFGVGLTAIKGLELHAEGRIEKIDDFSDNTINGGKVDLRQVAAYTLSDDLPLTIGIKAKEVLYGSADYEEDPWLQFKPYVSYKLPIGLLATLEGGYGFGYDADVVKEYDFYIKPKIEYNFGHGFATKVWYIFDHYKPEGLDGVNKNLIQLELTWAF
jgi:hypothetical protein